MVSTRNKKFKANTSKSGQNQAQKVKANWRKLKKLKEVNKVTVSEALQLCDSSVQETKSGPRDGSTLVMATKGTFIRVGDMLLEIMKTDKLVKKNLNQVKIVDIGGGLCTGLFALAHIHGMSAVSIESSYDTYFGSTMFMADIHKQVSLFWTFNFIILQTYLYSNIFILIFCSIQQICHIIQSMVMHGH